MHDALSWLTSSFLKINQDSISKAIPVTLTPNVKAEWISLVFIWMVPGSNLERQTGYSGQIFSWFSSDPSDEILYWPFQLPSISLQIHFNPASSSI
jgi:hypothetical protein